MIHAMRIARFVSGGSTFAGCPLDDGRSARVIRGDLFGEHELTNEVVGVDRWLAPIVPTDLLCIGLNYHEHARETGSDVPANPMLFIKSSNALSDPGAPIVLPHNSEQIDFEGELVVVIGTAARHVPSRARARPRFRLLRRQRRERPRLAKRKAAQRRAVRARQKL